MTLLKNKIDFAVVLSVTKANPNGDPLNDNRPRQNYDGYGEISDVAIKRKIRNRLMDMGESIFVQAHEKRTDTYESLRERVEKNTALALLEEQENITRERFAEFACREWIDVRSFGQVFAFKGFGSAKGVSIGVRGPVSLQIATSIDLIDITSTQITKSVNGEGSAGKAADTMGVKHRVDFGLYVFYGSINTQLAEKTGFTTEDATKIQAALLTLFENDASAARPGGSMEVKHVYWWEHKTKIGQYASAHVHRSLKINKKTPEPRAFTDYEVTVEPLEGLVCEVLTGW